MLAYPPTAPLQAQQLSLSIDALYDECFAGLTIQLPPVPDQQVQEQQEQPAAAAAPTSEHVVGQDSAGEQQQAAPPTTLTFDSMTETRFSALGREDPKVRVRWCQGGASCRHGVNGGHAWGLGGVRV